MADQGYQLDEFGLPVLAQAKPSAGYGLDADGLPVAAGADSAPAASPEPKAPAPQDDWWGQFWGPLKDHASQAFYDSTNGNPASMPETDPITARGLMESRAKLQQDIAGGSLAESDADAKGAAATAAARLAKIDHVLGIMGGGGELATGVAAPADLVGSLTHDKLMASDRYRQVYGAALPVLGHDQAQAYAKDTVSKDAHFIPYLRDGILASLAGAPDNTAFDQHYSDPLADTNASGYMTRVGDALSYSPIGIVLKDVATSRAAKIGAANIESGVSKIAQIPWLAGAALGMGADKVVSLFGGDTTAAEDFFFQHAQPLEELAASAQSGKPLPTGTAEKTVDKVTAMIPSLALAAATRNPEALEVSGAELFSAPAWRAAWDAAAASIRNNLAAGEVMATPGAVEAGRAVAENGGTSAQAAAATLGDLEQGTAQNVMPIAAGGTLARKALSGAAAQVAMGTAGRVAAGQRTDLSDIASEATIGAGMGQLHQELPAVIQPKFASAMDAAQDPEARARIEWAADQVVNGGKGAPWAAAELRHITEKGAARDEGAFQAWNDARAAQQVTETPEAEEATPEAAATTQAAEALVGTPEAEVSRPPTPLDAGAESVASPTALPAADQARPEATETAGPPSGENTTVETSVGTKQVDRSKNVPYYGSSLRDGTVAIDKDAETVIPDGPLKGLDVTPFIAEHEAVEKHHEDHGADYTESHQRATAAEHAKLLDHLGLEAGTVEANQAISEYEKFAGKQVAKSQAVENPDISPDIYDKPYEHPHNADQRRLLAEVTSAESHVAPHSDPAGDGEPVKSLKTPIGTVHVETAAGQSRSGTNEDGTPWSRTMRHDYGYLEGVPGRDGGSMDVLLGEGAADASRPVFVVDQKTGGGQFDEHKVLVGFKNQRDAERAYLSEYPKGWNGMGAMHQFTADEFHQWARTTGREEAQLGKVSPDVPRVTLRGQQPDAVAAHAIISAEQPHPGDRLTLPNASRALQTRTSFDEAPPGAAGQAAVLRNLYDTGGDPRGLFERARANLEARGLPLDEPHMENEFERLVVASGFDGYKADGKAIVLGSKAKETAHAADRTTNDTVATARPVADAGRDATPRGETAGASESAAADGARQDPARPDEAQGHDQAETGQAGGEGVRVPDEPPRTAAHQGVDETADTSIRNAATEAARAARGAEPVEKINGKSVDQIESEARAKLESNPSAGRELAHEVANNPRNISDVEAATLAIDRRRIAAEHADAMRRVDAAMTAKDAAGEAQARAALKLAEDAREQNERASTHAGTEWSNSGRARMLAAQKDESLVSLLTEHKIRAGRDLTPQERSTIEAQAKEIEALKSQIEAGVTGKKKVPKIVEAAAKSEFDKLVAKYHQIPREELMTKECML